MKIKKLSIHGFKSFVDKVSLNLSSGTSAIIGPNGCGKSNIVDAIRWVIGEQNPRHLRGKLMEDVIFNGSESRKPLGIAEVILTFANDNGSTPVRFADFPEIEIARRLYRSGESEYYINKVQCRLRDIVDLFTDTGVGTRAYSIVEQGQVSWLINAKPEERRVIFEEAAGINKFKHKKEAALRRLEATRENLTRVNDIISEVKRQLNSLNRQAKKAERYKALREEFKAVELQLSSIEFRRMTDGLSGLLKRLEGIKDSELKLATAVLSKEALLEEIRLDYQTVENGFREIREKVGGLEKRLQAEERENALASSRIEELKRNEERLFTEIEELENGKESVLADADRIRAHINELSTVIAEESQRAQELNKKLAALMDELKGAEEEAREKKSDSLGISTRLTDIRHSLQACLKDEELCREKQARASSEKAEAEKALGSKLGSLGSIKGDLEGTGVRKEAAEAEFLRIQHALTGIEKDRSVKEGERTLLKDEYAKTQARLLALEEMDRNLENIKDGARAVILKKAGSGVHGLIADVIETNSGFEKAVEAAMGERLQYVIVESHREGVEAVEYLKANASGRGSFMPLKDLRPANNPVPAGTGPHIHSGARELIGEVRVRDGYREIVAYLLGDVLVVEDLKSALEIWKNNGIYNKTLVTLAGEVVDPQGVITGGSASGADAGILQKRGEIKGLRARLSSLEERVRGLDSEINAADGEIDKTKTLLEEFRSRSYSVELEKVNLEAEFKRHEEESIRLKSALQSLDAEINDASRTLAGISARKSEFSRERDTLERALNETESEAQALTDKVSGLTKNKEGLSEAATGVLVTLAQSKERSESLKRELIEKERSAGETTKRLAAKSEEIHSGRAEMAERLKHAEALKARIDELLSSIDEAKKEEVARGETLFMLSERIKGVEHELKGVQQEIAELHELKGEISVEAKEMELNIRNLKDKIIEKYGVDIETFRSGQVLGTETGHTQDAEGGETQEAEEDTTALEARKEDLREKLSSLGEVSLSALEEYNELEQRHQFLLDQQTDLTKAVETLHGAITRINRTTRERFKSAFEEINQKFKENFPRFFNGGRAELRLTEEGDVLESGIEIVAQPPGKRLQNIALLSGGEKALTATSLIFSIFLIKPSPFCLLDEVDAPLDDANIDRFNGFVREMSALTQFILITHNKRTMEMADALYGITMEEPGVSKIISVRF